MIDKSRRRTHPVHDAPSGHGSICYNLKQFKVLPIYYTRVHNYIHTVYRHMINLPSPSTALPFDGAIECRDTPVIDQSSHVQNPSFDTHSLSLSAHFHPASPLLSASDMTANEMSGMTTCERTTIIWYSLNNQLVPKPKNHSVL